MRKHNKTCLIRVAILLPAVFVLTELLCASASDVCATERTISSKRAKDLGIVLMNEDGKLARGDNSFCLAFNRVETGEPADVQNVSIDFRLLVGKIQETPIRVRLTQVSVGQYRGRANLGSQYYSPSSYYAFVRYIDLAGKKRKMRFFFAVK
jgi:hypothetical protein